MHWASLSSNTLEFRDSLKRIKRGSTVLVVYANAASGDDVRDLGLVHAPCLAMIERSALVTTAFTVEGKQVMQVRDDYRDRVDTRDGDPPTLAQVLLAAEKHLDDKIGLLARLGEQVRLRLRAVHRGRGGQSVARAAQARRRRRALPALQGGQAALRLGRRAAWILCLPYPHRGRQ